MDYERFFVTLKSHVLNDFVGQFNPDRLAQLDLCLSYGKGVRQTQSDQYSSQASRVPAYYNPNSHTIHLNISILEQTDQAIIENIYYHELIHAASHHGRITENKTSIQLKSGLKIQEWYKRQQRTKHRGLNEGLTQYFANTFTSYGPAYRHEVAIIGQLIQKIGLRDLQNAYFDSYFNTLRRRTDLYFGENTFERLSYCVDRKNYAEAVALIDH